MIGDAPDVRPMEVPDGDGGPANSLVSLRSLRAATRRRRRFWLAMALTGLVLGSALHLVVPRKYSATADLYLVEPSGADPTRAMETDQSLLDTTTVAKDALEALHLHVVPQTFLASYQSTIVSDQVLSLSLTAHSPMTAVSEATAVAKAFLAFRSRELGSQNAVLVQGLQAQVSALQAGINGLTVEIDRPTGARASATAGDNLANLVDQRTADESQVSVLESEIQQDELDTTSISKGSNILDPAAVVRKSAAKVTATDGLSGLVAGLGLGLAIVVLGAILSEGVQSREEVAAALGAEVELSTGTWRRSRVLRRARLRRRLDRPGHDGEALRRRLAAHLETSSDGSLVVVAVQAGDPAAVAVGGLARLLASEGRTVTLVDLAQGNPLVDLLGADPGGIRLVVGDATDPFDQPAVPDGDADVTLTLATADPALGTDHLARWAASAVVVTAAGGASETLLRSVGRMLRRSGLDIRSAILVGAGADDETVGAATVPGMAADPGGRHGQKLWLGAR